jgi:hypothetical protein
LSSLRSNTSETPHRAEKSRERSNHGGFEMSHEMIVEFVGFEAVAHARVYSFTVREPFAESRDSTLTISTKTFSEHLIS